MDVWRLEGGGGFLFSDGCRAEGYYYNILTLKS